MSDLLTRFDDWLKDDSDVAALVMRQWLEPVEGKDAVIFPPTYAKPERVRDEGWTGYNVDRFRSDSDASNSRAIDSVCQIDSVGSQANRMEPTFKREEYRHLVPQIVIEANGREVHLLDAGHRAADAIARFSTLGPKLHEAFRAFHQDGNAEKLARIAPTSIVFGSWDSRATQAKLPRVVRSVIRAFNVDELHRSAQYSTIAGEILEGGDAEVTTKGPKAELGLAHVPAVMTHGGVLVRGEIRREAVLNLVPLRALKSESREREDTLALRRYVLGLGLVAFTASPDTFLREGCQLVPAENRNIEWKIVKHDGTREAFNIAHKDAQDFATKAAKDFQVDQPKQPAQFDADLAKKVLALGEKERKALLKSGSIAHEAIESVSAKGKEKGQGRKK